MNFYVSLINNTLDYIENNIDKELSLEEISQKFCVSAFHFNRMFRTVTGRTLKQYILGRKLTKSLEILNSSDKSIINVALDFGFEYPEVFSRNFKKQFGISPIDFKREKPKVNTVSKLSIVERDIVNYQGNLTLKGTGVYLDELQLNGIQIEVNINSVEFKQQLKTAGNVFSDKAQKILGRDKFYTLVNCSGDDGQYNVFYGMKTESSSNNGDFITRLVPSGWYEKFVYCGDMFDVRESFVDDLYRWVIVKEAELECNGIGMINIYETDYEETKKVQILVPVKEPK